MTRHPMLFSSLPDDACDYYRALYAPACEEHADLRDQCEDLWRDFHGHADKNFLTDFPRRFHERWFEMYLTVALKRSGLNVTCIKPGPDILIQDGERRIW